MDIDEKLKLLKEVGEEIVEEKELRKLLSEKREIIAYDGFEPSGKIHIAQGLLRAININKVVKTGIKFKMLVADWHAWANNKMGGDLENIQTTVQLEQIRSKYLSRKGLLAELFAEMKDVEPQLRPQAGKALNELKELFQEKYQALLTSLSEKSGQKDKLDLTLSGRIPFIGRRHPLTTILEQIKTIFFGMGFRIEDGPEIETDYYNFEALNMPKNHPARDMQDTLYISQDVVLRTHTSPVQIRVMESQQPPIRIIAPGRVYRKDTPDASHSPFFQNRIAAKKLKISTRCDFLLKKRGYSLYY